MSYRPALRPARVMIAAVCGTLVAGLTVSGAPSAEAGTVHPATGAEAKPTKTAGAAQAKAARVAAARTMKPRTGIFSSTSVWHDDIRHAPLAANSAAVVDNLAAQVHDNWGGVAAFNYNSFNVSFFKATRDTPVTTLKFDDCQDKGYVPAELYDPAQGAVFVDVPIPADARPAEGTDGEMSIWDPATDQLWEFWQAHHEADGWYACWGGRIDHVSKSAGFFPGWTGVAATALSTTAGAIGIKEAQRGRINHAISLNVIDAANWTKFSWPAQRSDGNLPVDAPDAVEEGQRFRLDPRVDLRKLHLTRIGRMVARAAKKYGFVVVDRGGAVAVMGESGLASERLTGVDPWSSLMRGVPGYDILRNFPWDDLQALPVDYGKP